MSESRPLPQLGSEQYWAEVTHLVDNELLPRETARKIGKVAVRVATWEGLNKSLTFMYGYKGRLGTFQPREPAVAMTITEPSILAPAHFEGTTFVAHLRQRQLAVAHPLLTPPPPGATFEEVHKLAKGEKANPSFFLASAEEYATFLSELREGARQRRELEQ